MIYRQNRADAGLRLVTFLLFSTAGRIITGAILIIIGLFYGFKSHNVVYHQKDLHAYTIYSNTQTVNYSFQDKYSSNFYQANLNDFATYFEVQDFQNATISMVYTDLDSSAANGGNGHNMVRLAIVDENGHELKVFATNQFLQHPKSYFENKWPTAAIWLGIGAGFWLVTWLLWLTIPKIIAWQDRRKPKEFSEKQIARMYNEQKRNPWTTKRSFDPPPDFTKLSR